MSTDAASEDKADVDTGVSDCCRDPFEMLRRCERARDARDDSEL